MLILFALILFAFCGASASAQASATAIVGAGCSGCEVALRVVARLGNRSGDGMLELDRNNVRVDQQGRFYVYGVGPPYVWVFGPSGDFLQRIGDRGEGPGEFQMIAGLVLASDSILVFDPLQNRMTVYDPELVLARTQRVDPPVAGNNAFASGQVIVLNEGIRTADHVGFPLHILSFHGHVERSFGSLTQGLYRPDMREIINLRAVSPTVPWGGVWSAYINQYTIERWDLDSGTVAETLTRDVEWFPTWWEPEGDAETAPVPVVTDLHVEGDTLWVMIVVPDPEWQSNVERTARLYRVTDPDGYKDTVIEAIDLTDGRLIVSHRFDDQFSGFLGTGLIADPHVDDGGNPIVRILEASISRHEGGSPHE